MVVEMLATLGARTSAELIRPINAITAPGQTIHGGSSRFAAANAQITPMNSPRALVAGARQFAGSCPVTGR